MKARIAIVAVAGLARGASAAVSRLAQICRFQPSGRHGVRVGTLVSGYPHASSGADRAASVIAPAVKTAIALGPYVVRVVLADGEVRDVDIEPLLDGQVFAALRDPAVFAQVEVDEHGETIVWPNGADLDPEVLYGIAAPASRPAPRVSTPDRA